MEKKPSRQTRLNNAIMVYVILLLSLQIFLLTVAAEGFLDQDPGLAWSATGISVVLALSTFFFFRYLRDE